MLSIENLAKPSRFGRPAEALPTGSAPDAGCGGVTAIGSGGRCRGFDLSQAASANAAPIAAIVVTAIRMRRVTGRPSRLGPPCIVRHAALRLEPAPNRHGLRLETPTPSRSLSD